MPRATQAQIDYQKLYALTHLLRGASFAAGRRTRKIGPDGKAYADPHRGDDAFALGLKALDRLGLVIETGKTAKRRGVYILNTMKRAEARAELDRLEAEAEARRVQALENSGESSSPGTGGGAAPGNNPAPPSGVSEREKAQ